uniref:Uncharacterized protein n=1 Tax=Aegilops tauschii TaxID=37682 RepID=M8D6B0_AEGTA
MAATGVGRGLAGHLMPTRCLPATTTTTSSSSSSRHCRLPSTMACLREPDAGGRRRPCSGA